jgi:hypothetical protein
MKDFSEEFKKEIETRTSRFLHIVGQVGVNAAAAAAPVVTGRYRNSIMYRIYKGEGSGFGQYPGVVPGSSEILEAPDRKRTVRTGSNVVYAGSVERRHGTLVSAFDQVSAKLDRIAEEVFG